jgi:hypothetical protein
MAKRRFIVLGVAITALCFIPAVVQAGAGGSPAAPGAAAAGSTSAYCCSSWVDDFIGEGKKAVPVLSGSGCTAIEDTAAARNSCSLVSGKAAKCRGEIFDPVADTVTRCFSP